MERSRKILLVSHCVLNQNTVVEPLARDQGGLLKKILPYMEAGVGIVQLPCPEMRCMGLRRWGHVREQFDHPHFRNQSREMLLKIVDDISEYIKNDYDIVGIGGVEGSPSCGCNKTCSSIDWKGNIGRPELKEKVEVVKDKGIFMEEFQKLLNEKDLEINFFDLIKMDD